MKVHGRPDNRRGARWRQRAAAAVLRLVTCRAGGRLLTVVCALSLELCNAGFARAQSPMASPSPETARKAQYMVLLVATLTLLLAFVPIGMILVRALRRSRAQLAMKPESPTDTTDVWSMHRVPDDALGATGNGTSAEDDS